jgi:hypothetical protein
MLGNYAGMVVPGFGSTKVTPNDNIVFDPPSRGLWIGTAGNISVTFPDGAAAVDMPAQAGFFPYFVIQVNEGSTAPAADNIWTIV